MNKLRIGDIYNTTEICIEYPMTGNYTQYVFKDNVESLVYSFLEDEENNSTIINIDFNTGLSGDYVRITFNSDLISHGGMIDICNELIENLNNKMLVDTEYPIREE